MTDSVSRETPSAPDVARRVFSDALPTAEAFCDLLATAGVERGLLGPREVPRLWERHLLNCALVAEAIPLPEQGGRRVTVCDIGTGAGLPGLVLALLRPELEVTLVEPLLRRTTFLDEAVVELGLGNVEVVRARAEELHGVREFDVVTSRAVAPLPRLLGWSMPLVRRGGVLLAMKGASAVQELAEAASALSEHGAGPSSVQEWGIGVIDPPTTVVKVEAGRPSRLGLAPHGAGPSKARHSPDNASSVRRASGPRGKGRRG